MIDNERGNAEKRLEEFKNRYMLKSENRLTYFSMSRKKIISDGHYIFTHSENNTNLNEMKL